MGSKNIFLFGINGLKIMAWWAWLQDMGFDSPSTWSFLEYGTSLLTK
jgi:hypothetical protein